MMLKKSNKNKNLIFVKYDNSGYDGFRKPQVKEGVVATRKWKCLPIPMTAPMQRSVLRNWLPQ